MTELFLVLLRILFPLDPVAREQDAQENEEQLGHGLE